MAQRPANPPPMLVSVPDLEAVIAQCGLSDASSLILPRARLGFRILLRPSKCDSMPGETRFGGVPDLPVGAAWPASDQGLLTFFGQINLQDIAQQSALPGAGLLSFFGGPIEGAAFPIETHALWTPPGVALAQGKAESFADGCAPLLPIGAEFQLAMTLPLDDLDFLTAIEATAPFGDIDALINAVQAAPENQIGMVLGCPMTMQDDLQAAIALDALGRSGIEPLLQWRTWAEWEAAKRMELRMKGGALYRPWLEEDDGNVRWLQAHRATVDAEISAWTPLLRIDSNRAMNLWINDADPICFFVRIDALAAGNFGEVRARATQG
jgi:Domain of unknown function (DUF1963)